jgi:hypothetical protein
MIQLYIVHVVDCSIFFFFTASMYVTVMQVGVNAPHEETIRKFAANALVFWT